MPTVRLGIIADSYLPVRYPSSSFIAIENAFRHVDAILHAGSVIDASTTQLLASIAPLQAVRGDDDDVDLPEERFMTINGVRICLTHGHRHRLIEGMYQVRRRLGHGHAGQRGIVQNLIDRYRPQGVQVIIFGHSAEPLYLQRDGMTLFSPGMLHHLSSEDLRWQMRHETEPNRKRHLEQAYNAYPHNRHARSSVGILEISAQHQVSGCLIELPIFDLV